MWIELHGTAVIARSKGTIVGSNAARITAGRRTLFADAAKISTQLFARDSGWKIKALAIKRGKG
jgi:hypothetical protein